MVWWSAPAVTARDIFKSQNVNVVQSAGALVSLKRRQNKIRISPTEIINCHGYPSSGCSRIILLCSGPMHGRRHIQFFLGRHRITPGHEEAAH